MVHISLCMIVRNEEKSLPRCLDSVKDWVTEMILVDTGSLDRTVAIAESYGAQVYHQPWGGDFSAPRNESLRHAHGDWILVLDADEWLLPEVRDALEAIMAQPQALVINLLRQEIGASQSPYSLVSRLFRRHGALEFRRPYHAMIDDSVTELIKQEPQWQIANCAQVAIAHDGYQAEVITRLDKLSRAKMAMEKYFLDHPHDPYVCAKLGGAYLQERNAKLALKVLKQGLKCSAQASPELLYELHYSLANAHRLLEDNERAIKHYQKALDQPILPILKIGGFTNVGNLFYELKYFDQAERLHRAILQLDPEYGIAYYNLGLALKAQEKFPEAIAAYEKAIALEPGDPWAKQNLAALLFRLGRIDESVDLFRQAIDIHQNSNPQEAQRLYTQLRQLTRHTGLGVQG